MGAGRRTSTYDVDTSAGPNIRSFEDRQRNLGSQLYGCIFGCNHDTFKECVTGLVFGLPRPHWCYVQYIQKGMPIFLFNYSDRKLHGIFKAESDGTWELNPKGWCRPGQSYTSYPCQVQVSVFLECNALQEKEYRDTVKHCFMDDGHLRFELRKPEAQNLCRIFERNSPGYTPAATPSARPTPTIAPAAARQGATASAASAAATPRQQQQQQQPAAASGKQAVPGEDFIESDWQSVAAKKKSFKAAAQPAQNAWNKAAKNDLESRPSAAGSEVSDNAKQQPAGADAAKDAQRQAWEQQARKKAAALETGHSNGEASSRPADQAASYEQTNGFTSEYTGPDYNQETQHEVQHTTMEPQGMDDQLTALHGMMAPLDVGAADALWTTFYEMHSRLQEAERFRDGFAASMEHLLAENDTLKNQVASMQHNQQLIISQMKQLAAGQGPSRAAPQPTAGPSSSAAAAGPSENGFAGSRGQTVYLLGGNNGKEWLDRGDTFTPSINTWSAGAANLPSKHGYGAAAAIGRSIYLVGGGQGETWLSSVLRYDVDDQAWFECGHMNEVRGSLGAAALKGRIYAIGGGQPDRHEATAEVLDPELNVWMSIKTMANKRFTTACAVVDNAVYAVGGYNGEVYLNTAELLDPRTGRWNMLPTMARKRGSTSAVALGSDLVVVGGFDGSMFHDSVEVYDTRAGQWRELASMAEPRAYASAANLNGRLYAIGGMLGSEQGHNTTLESYDAHKDQWRLETFRTVSSTDADGVRLAFAAACVMDAAEA